MISAGEPQEFAPLGRLHLANHPGDVYLPVQFTNTNTSPLHQSGDLLRALKGVSLRDQQQKEQWLLKERSDSEGEEELYFSGKTVVWSKSSGHGVRNIYKSFTVEAPVQQVLFCSFYFDKCKPDRFSEKSHVSSGGSPLSGICIVDSSKLTIYSETGQDYLVAVPFQVSRSWSFKYGLLFERSVATEAEEGEQSGSKKPVGDHRPVIFSMLHPIDDIAPVIKKTGAAPCNVKLSYFDDPSEQVVFTSVEPSLALTFSGTDGLHSVWKLRTATTEEANHPSLRLLCDPQWLLNTSLTHSSVPTNSSSIHSKHATSTQTSIHTPSYSSPFRSHPSSRVSSPSGLQSHSNSPSVSALTHMATLSRSQSPLMNNSATRKCNFTPITSGAMVHLSPLSPLQSTCEFVEPLLPDICFDHEWTEPSNHITNEGASKAFLSNDITGQSFLCYLLKEKQQLKMIKFEDSNDSTHWIFGSVSVIPALDAEALSSLNLLVILDGNGYLTLYTGLTKVSKIHVTNMVGPFSEFPGMSCSSRRTSRAFGTPRRSSLISSCHPPGVLDTKFTNEVQHLSPVPVHIEHSPAVGLPVIEESSSSSSSFINVAVISGLRDGVKNRVTLETPSGPFFRLSIPIIADSATVTKCLNALRCILPRDTFIHVFTKWYATRNAPGSCDMSNQSELNQFLLCLMSITGYNTDSISLGGIPFNDLYSSPAAIKKQKTNENGSDEDWSYLLCSHTNESLWKRHSHVMNIEKNSVQTLFHLGSNKINTCALLYPYITHVLCALHLVYEDCKLNVTLWNDLPKLCTLLFELARDLNLDLYKDHYWRDFPEQAKNISEKEQLTAEDRHKINYTAFLPPSPPSIFGWIQNMLKGLEHKVFPYIPNVTKSLHDIVLVYCMLTLPAFSDSNPDLYLQRIVAPGMRIQEETFSLGVLRDAELSDESRRSAAVVEFLTKLGVTIEDISTLPVGVALTIQDAILHCRNNPQPNWKEDSYNFIGRQDLNMLHLSEGGKVPPVSQKSKYCSELSKYGVPKDSEDGLDYLDHDVLRLRFSRDHRIHDVYRMLQSSKPVRIVLQQRPEVSDHEFIEEQERHLYSLCIRTMALPVGRGMFTLRTCKPVVTETLPIPKLCLTGRTPPRNTTVDLSHIDVPANMNMWPLFHNGVAAGLRIAPNASQIDSTWMVYNKPRSSSNDTPTEHAGFLMALGLNGHLANLTSMSIHDYLCKGHELTSVGILLGVAAANRGTMDVGVTKLLSIHVEALLPPTSTELDVPPVVQVAAVLGIGLLYQGSAHHHMSEILLGEIGRPPGPEMEHCVDRESYALAAGLALGLVTFAKGKDVSGLTDQPMADQLYHYMVGAHRRPLTGIHKEKHKSPSYQIREGDSVNVDVTSPGATLALGMMFFDTGNEAIAEWMTAPDTQCLLDMVRPDFLLLRTLSKGLIMWSFVHPSRAWVKSHIPEIVSTYAFKRGQGQGSNSDVDYETMSQAFCNIIAGCCLCLGLKFAGSANKEAFETLMYYTKIFLSITGKSLADQAGKSTIETCLNVCVLSLAMVMAGRGDLDVLRICRHLRSRVSQSSSYVLYGSHMATHMALGLLFLGGGRFTLSTSPLAVGAMICSFFPKFPTHSNDNRYHLQAFYHLYVLAVEPRLIIPRHIDTNKPVYTHIRIRFKDTPWYKNVDYTVMAPCILPQLDLLKQVIVEDKRYWPIVFDFDKNWETLRNTLNNNGALYVKQKAGCLPYSEDPQGFRSLLARNFIKNNVHGWNLKNLPISKFSSDPMALNFASSFLHYSPEAVQEKEWQQKMCELLFECASKEKMEILPSCIMLIQMAKEIKQKHENLDLWQIKLLQAYDHWQQHRCSSDSEDNSLIKRDVVVSIRKSVEKSVMEQIQESAYNQEFMRYFYGSLEYHEFTSSLASFVVLHDLPFSCGINCDISDDDFCFPLLYLKLRDLNMSVSSVMAVLNILNASTMDPT